MITSLVGRYQFREVPSWRAVRELQWEISSFPGWVAFSPDGRFVALEISPAVVHLIDAASGRTLARLQDPDADRARWLGITADGAKLVVIAGYSKAIHLWDLRRIGRDLVAIGLRDELVASLPSEGPGRTFEIRAEAELSLAGAAEERARDRIARSRKRHEEKPDGADECNSLAWAYLIAPQPLRDPDQALVLARKATRLAPDDPMFRNTLGVAHYRLGRYREAVEALRRSRPARGPRPRLGPLLPGDGLPPPRGGRPRPGIPELGPSMEPRPEGLFRRRASRAVVRPRGDGGDAGAVRPLEVDRVGSRSTSPPYEGGAVRGPATPGEVDPIVRPKNGDPSLLSSQAPAALPPRRPLPGPGSRATDAAVVIVEAEVPGQAPVQLRHRP